ncbi:MAG: transposase [Cyanobacteria bacterium P01_E01_bin.35]
MLEIKQVIQDYILAWNSSDSEQRMTSIAKVLSENCLYIDSHLPEPITGRELHCQFIARFREKFPELTLYLVSAPDSHHGYLRFGWQLLKANGEIFTQGSFFGEINKQDQITKLVGFVDVDK